MKQPWEMTTEEFGDVYLMSPTSNECHRLAAKYCSVRREELFGNASPDNQVNICGVTVIGQSNGLPVIEGQSQIDGLRLLDHLGLGINSSFLFRHEHCVRQALAENLPVPDEIASIYDSPDSPAPFSVTPTSNRYIYANEFHDIFGLYLKDYWDKWFGFKITDFDDAIKCPDGISLHDHLLEKYGERAQLIIHELNQEAPLLDKLKGIPAPDFGKRS